MTTTTNLQGTRLRFIVVWVLAVVSIGTLLFGLLAPFFSLHPSFGEGDASDLAHFLVGSKQQVDLTLERNAEGVFDERTLPGVHVGLLGREHNVVAFGKRGGLGDGHRLRRARLHALARQPVG